MLVSECEKCEKLNMRIGLSYRDSYCKSLAFVEKEGQSVLQVCEKGDELKCEYSITSDGKAVYFEIDEKKEEEYTFWYDVSGYRVDSLELGPRDYLEGHGSILDRAKIKHCLIGQTMTTSGLLSAMTDYVEPKKEFHLRKDGKTEDVKILGYEYQPDISYERSKESVILCIK